MNRAHAFRAAFSARTALAFALAGIMSMTAVGCSKTPKLTQSGFLSSYDSLEEVKDFRLKFVDPELKNVTSFILDPVQINVKPDDMSDKKRDQVAVYFRDTLTTSLEEHGYAMKTAAGPDTARIRIAITDVTGSGLLRKIWPASRLAGAGRAGAAMEAEIVDSNSGKQLAAAVRAGTGSQFTIMNFTQVSDIENVIDRWVKDAVESLDTLRGTE